MSTTLRELKYVLLGDDRLSNKLRGVSQAGDKANNSLRNQSERLAKLRNDFKGAADEIPGVSQGLAMLSNPLVLGAAGLVGIGAGIKKATNEAQKFNSNFRELANLNLDKSYSQIKGLKTLVQNTAYRGGFDQNLTSKAFFDVQSITGKNGGEVANIVSKQGEFANVFKADFNSWIAGTAKAMANYGFGAEKLNEFNKASYATYLTAAMTFDELAKVQSVYAGAAASARQSFSSANKMLSIFTIKTKSADEAATLTKSLFNDFTKTETRKALHDIGVELYDSHDKIKQADVVLLELNKRFKELGSSDKKVMALKNQFTGSEGLISFVQSATDSSGMLLNTLHNFDSAELGFNKALALARKDVDYINDQLKNRTNILMSKIGDHFLKIKAPIVESLNKIMEADDVRRTGLKETGKALGASNAVKNFGYISNGAEKMSTDEYKLALNNLKSEMEKTKINLKEYAPYQNAWFHLGKKELSAYYSEYALTLSEIMKTSMLKRNGSISANNLFSSEKTTDTSVKGLESTFSKGLDSVSGGGNAIRNITVNITKLIETQQINTQNMTEGTQQVQQLVEAALIRAVAGTEQMMAS